MDEDEDEQEPEYTLDQLIELTEEIKKNGSGDFSSVKAALCLAKEIKKIQYDLDQYFKPKQRMKKSGKKLKQESWEEF